MIKYFCDSCEIEIDNDTGLNPAKPIVATYTKGDPDSAPNIEVTMSLKSIDAKEDLLCRWCAHDLLVGSLGQKPELLDR